MRSDPSSKDQWIRSERTPRTFEELCQAIISRHPKVVAGPARAILQAWERANPGSSTENFSKIRQNLANFAGIVEQVVTIEGAMQSVPEFDAYVDTYEEDHRKSIRLSGEGPDFFSEYKVAELARMVRNSGLSVSRVLDFGAGIGNSVPPFRRHFPDAELSLADVSRESLDKAIERHGAVENCLQVVHDHLPCADSSFDITFSACVFHHIPADQHIRWLEELRRVTRPGGWLVVFEHNPWNPLTRHAVATCSFDENAVLISAPELARRFECAGWKAPATRYHMFFPSPCAVLRKYEPALGWCPLGAQYSCVGQASGQ